MTEVVTDVDPKQLDKHMTNKEIELENSPIVLKKWQIWKNLAVICLAWVLLFTAFQGNF
jgi:hypothetical protein